MTPSDGIGITIKGQIVFSKFHKSLEKSMRICSFQSGTTEIGYALGLQEQLVGVTSKCDYPAEAREKPVIVRSVFDSTHLTSGEITRMIS